MRALFIALCAVLMLSAPAMAVQPGEVLPDPVLEQRARALSKELRCMVCQNESIDESNAPLARDLRLMVRERLSQGASDQQVLDFLVSRYGDFVLLRPRLTAGTLILWGAPILALLIGGFVLASAWRKRASAAGDVAVERGDANLTADEQAKVNRLLETLPRVNEADRRA
jgi:cytochrome c-type biogenesis protein CcmH